MAGKKLTKKVYEHTLKESGIEIEYTKLPGIRWLAMRKEQAEKSLDGDALTIDTLNLFVDLIHEFTDLENTKQEIEDILSLEEITELGTLIAGMNDEPENFTTPQPTKKKGIK